MKVSFLKNAEEKSWNNFLFQNKGSFLQSFEWGEFQKSLSKRIWRMRVEEGGSILAEANIIKEIFPLKIKSLFYIPFGPCLKKDISSIEAAAIMEAMLEEVRRLAKSEGAVFLRIEPFSEIVFSENPSLKISLKRIQPQKTLILNLDREEKEIFNNFAQKVRYNIRLAQRKGVKISFSSQYNPAFYALIRKTSRRDGFFPFKEEHYKKLFSSGSENFKVKLCLADYQNKIIASYILIIFGERAVCLHGASDWEYRALKAPNLAQWERIREAKKMGAKEIDFWGIDEKKWPGITSFKRGFGGEEIEYPSGRDIIFQRKWYKLYQSFRKLK